MKRVLLVLLALLAGALPTGASAAGVRTFTAQLRGENGSKAVGTARLTYAPGTRMLTIRIVLRGMRPGSLHAAHVHIGTTCRANGPVAVPLPNLRADRRGMIVRTLRMRSPGFRGRGRYLNIHRGANLAVARQAQPIVCGLVRLAR